MQVKDPFILDNEEWIFIGAEDIYSLFDPENFGLKPESPNTACHKGFIIKFLVKNNQLSLDELSVYCGDNHYPLINNVEPLPPNSFRMRVYKNINLPLHYSGIITIAKDLIDRYTGRAFTGPHCYKTVFELTFENGQLKEKKETSGTYIGFCT